MIVGKYVRCSSIASFYLGQGFGLNRSKGSETQRTLETSTGYLRTCF